MSLTNWGGVGFIPVLVPGIRFPVASPSFLGATSSEAKGDLDREGGRGLWLWSLLGWRTFGLSNCVNSLPSFCNLLNLL